jgi:hypothetical protein
LNKIYESYIIEKFKRKLLFMNEMQSHLNGGERIKDGRESIERINKN